MTRRKLSEYRSKVLITEALSLPYVGWSINFNSDLDKQINSIKDFPTYVLKVDQGIKGRFKKGLVILNLSKDKLVSEIKKLNKKGYTFFIVEPQVSHTHDDERYLSLSHDRQGNHLSHSRLGGIDIESHADSIKVTSLNKSTDWDALGKETGFSASHLKSLTRLFKEDFMTLLEINPYLVTDKGIKLLDLAIEVDDAGDYFTEKWSEDDFRQASSKKISTHEQTVHRLDEKSPASLKLEMINPNGSIFLLLSGGGASVVVADEIHNLGLGKQLANYGEYSGNPNTEETYIYTSSVLKLLLASTAKKKVLFIGGAVANFTDVANTFAGIIQAVDELSSELKKQNVKIFVRRGGPRQEIGLAKIKTALEKHGLLGAVHDPSTPLTTAVAEAVEEIAR